ncbi:putative phage abortive infection protein [Catalinimonas sp. 4WD22]|uniref:putative phage abortive infection protein n=1 Tax=Catalinimonas locisalis TaxID=3133978 RepID=UPI003100C8F1
MQKQKKTKNKYKPFIITASLVIALWASSGLAITFFYGSLPDSPGTFGDMFGMINSLFSGLAFAGLIYTILQQREELDLTRQEFIKQNETFRLQRFENTFFQLLRLNDDLLDGHTISSNHESVETRVYLHMISAKIIESIDKRLEMLRKDNVSSQFSPLQIQNQRFTIVQHTLESYNKEIENSLLHYLNNLFSIVQLVDASELIGKEEKLLYVNILKTQMSVSERTLLFFMLIARQDIKRQKALYDQYQFLDAYANSAFDGIFRDIYRNV